MILTDLLISLQSFSAYQILFAEKHAFLLGTQWRDIIHADPTCPYVTEELRMINLQGKGESDSDSKQTIIFNKAKIETTDISDLLPQETIGYQICEMPCCDSKLPYHTWRIDDYRRSVGINQMEQNQKYG